MNRIGVNSKSCPSVLIANYRRYIMGDIIKILSGRIPPSIYIERRIDNIETQKLKFNLTKESWLSTETGDSIRLFGRSEDCNIIEVEIPISIIELKDALEKLG